MRQRWKRTRSSLVVMNVLASRPASHARSLDVLCSRARGASNRVSADAVTRDGTRTSALDRSPLSARIRRHAHRNLLYERPVRPSAISESWTAPSPL